MWQSFVLKLCFNFNFFFFESVEWRHTHRTDSECRRQDERSTGMTFDLHGYKSRWGSRKSTTSLSAKRTASPRLDTYCWEQEPDRTTEGRVGSPAAWKADGKPPPPPHCFQFSWEVTWQMSSPSRTFWLVKKVPLKPVTDLRIKSLLLGSLDLLHPLLLLKGFTQFIHFLLNV